MEEAFFRTHTYLVEHTDAPVRRTLMDEIDWSDRLIGIKGTRGVGKSTFLLQYAKEHFGPTDRKCLYVNMNNFYFQSRGIADFAGDFVRHGGRTLGRRAAHRKCYSGHLERYLRDVRSSTCEGGRGRPKAIRLPPRGLWLRPRRWRRWCSRR